LAKWQEQNPQLYQETLSTFHKFSDPTKALDELMRRRAPEMFGLSESEERDMEDCEDPGTRGSKNHDFEDLVELSLKFNTGDLVDLM
jgi:hypothetical protein